MEYLGSTREAIGFEKAGIFRKGRTAVCADADPPQSLTAHAAAIGAPLLLAGRDFGWDAEKTQWLYWDRAGRRGGLPHPALRGTYQIGNAAGCLAALGALRERLPVAMNAIRAGLVTVENPARFQVLPGRPSIILDVAHNPQAASALADSLAAMGRPGGKTYAVFSMLKDKDIAGVASALRDTFDCWFIAPSFGPRGADAALLHRELAHAGVGAPVIDCADTRAAYGEACDRASLNDRIVVFGSFLTVAAVIEARAPNAVNGACRSK
jgi:dihydrofolate synthase/folylpolyglutamate synthase